MAFEYRFNVIRFYSKLNRFVLSPRKKPNHFVLKIRPGGFADYTLKTCKTCKLAGALTPTHVRTYNKIARIYISTHIRVCGCESPLQVCKFARKYAVAV